MFDPRDDARDRDGRENHRARVYDNRNRDDDPREGLMLNLDLPRGEERELVAVRDRVYELDGEESRTLAAVGAFPVVAAGEHRREAAAKPAGWRTKRHQRGSCGLGADEVGGNGDADDGHIERRAHQGGWCGHQREIGSRAGHRPGFGGERGAGGPWWRSQGLPDWLLLRPPHRTGRRRGVPAGAEGREIALLGGLSHARERGLPG